MKRLGTIKEIDPSDQESWEGRFFLTFDIDWAHEEIIMDCNRLVSEAGVPSTWFITHSGSHLKALKADPLVEIGIHPNFNGLVNGQSQGNSIEVVNNLQALHPSATSLRSHSLLQSERLIDLFREMGLTHISNLYIPRDAGFKPNPFFIWDQMIVVPHTYQDNVEMRSNKELSLAGCVNRGSHCVVLMHPIHVFLNSTSMDLYEQTRAYHKEPERLVRFRDNHYGIRDSLREALEILS